MSAPQVDDCLLLLRGQGFHGNCSPKRIHGAHQLVPGGLNTLIISVALRIVVFFKLLDAPLKLCEAAADTGKSPIVFKPHTDILSRQSLLEQVDPRGQILNLSQNAT